MTLALEVSIWPPSLAPAVSQLIHKVSVSRNLFSAARVSGLASLLTATWILAPLDLAFVLSLPTLGCLGHPQPLAQAWFCLSHRLLGSAIPAYQPLLVPCH